MAREDEVGEVVEDSWDLNSREEGQDEELLQELSGVLK